LTSRLVQHLRSEGKRVAVVAVDPTSPFSGGALLGDRIRMQAHWADPEVFIRSVATRGAVGGLSRTAGNVVRVLAAWGAEVVLLETVGVGQDELDVVRVAHSTLVVQAPGAGDDLQAAKAGLLECADVFAVNKSDLGGAEGVVQDLRSMLALGEVTGATREADWQVPVVACVAARDEGVQAVLADLKRHYRWLHDTPRGQARRSARLREELTMLIREALSAMVLERYRNEIEQAVVQVTANEIDPYTASRALISRWQI
jgi:LAO/AO transport system kinase